MNSLYNHALKQSHALQRDLDKFAFGQDLSAGLQGQICIVYLFTTLNNDYDNLAKREMVAVKKETALNRVSKFRQELQEMRTRFETTKKIQENLRMEQNRESLLARRPNRGQFSEAPEHPYQPMTRSAFAQREQSFADHTDTQLDDFITQAQNVLESLTDQHTILKVSITYNIKKGNRESFLWK
ncbi:unnamed protein product [Cunninghamella echinulata]